MKSDAEEFEIVHMRELLTPENPYENDQVASELADLDEARTSRVNNCCLDCYAGNR